MVDIPVTIIRGPPYDATCRFRFDGGREREAKKADLDNCGDRYGDALGMPRSSWPCTRVSRRRVRVTLLVMLRHARSGHGVISPLLVLIRSSQWWSRAAQV
jgi:hypothetical protein